MILTRNYSRIAVLTDDLIEKLFQRYRSPALVSFGDDVRGLIRWIYGHFSSLSNKSELLTEWMLRSISNGMGRPEDIGRFEAAARFYFDHVKEDKFKSIVKDYNALMSDNWGDVHSNINPKNILDFSLHDLEEIQELYEQPKVDPRVNQLGSKLLEGAQIVYNDGKYQIVEITSGKAACDLARGTRWCTSREEVAQGYLDRSPLYVIYLNGRKIAQIFIDTYDLYETQLMDLKDNPIQDINPELLKAFTESGLLTKVFDLIEKHAENSNEYGYEKNGQDEMGISQYLEKWVGSNPPEELLKLLSQYPYLSYIYATEIIKGRFLEGENAILKKEELSGNYAIQVLKGRWKEAEPGIVKYNWGLYLYILNLKRAGKFEEFVNDWGKNLDVKNILEQI